MKNQSLRELNFSSLNKSQLSMQIYENLLQVILSGELDPGTKLPINDLSESYGISNTPIREALNKLMTDGLLEKIPYQGFRVKKFTLQEIKEIYETRIALESYSCKLAAQRIEEKDKKRLVHLQEQGMRFFTTKNYESYIDYNNELHFSIFQISQNKKLMRLYEKISHQIMLLASKSVHIIGRSQIAVYEHKKIVDYICQGRYEEVPKIMEEHLKNGYKDIEDHFSQMKG